MTQKNVSGGAYATANLLENLRKDAARQLSVKKLSWGKFSSILYDNPKATLNNYKLSTVKAAISSTNKAKFNPDYLLSQEHIDIFSKNWAKQFKDAQYGLDLMKKYTNAYDLRHYIKGQSEKHNPNLVMDFFKKIDTVEKAFWLGFLCADGSIVENWLRTDNNITTRRKKPTRSVWIELAEKDEIIIKWFCDAIGLNYDNKIKRRERKDYRSGEPKMHSRLVFSDKDTTNYMILQGFSSLKSKRDELPKFWYIPDLDPLLKREILLGFIRGYYDGDGHSNVTEIGAANKQFLENVKKALNIQNPVILTNEIKEFYDDKGQLHRHERFYRLSLGARLFNEMTNICKDNGIPLLARKDKNFDESAYAYQDLKDIVMNREILQTLVSKIPLYQLRELLGCSERIFNRLREEWNIDIPPRGYWINHLSLMKINPCLDIQSKIRNLGGDF